MIAIFAIVMTVVGPIIVGLGVLLSILPFVAAGFALITLPVILITAAIVAVIAVVALLIIYWDELVDFFSNSAIFAGVKAGFMVLISPITTVIDLFEKIMSFDFSNILGDIKGFFGFGGEDANINSNATSQSTVDVNLSAPEGVVKSVKSSSDGGTKLNLGTNMVATAM